MDSCPVTDHCLQSLTSVSGSSCLCEIKIPDTVCSALLYLNHAVTLYKLPLADIKRCVLGMASLLWSVLVCGLRVQGDNLGWAPCHFWQHREGIIIVFPPFFQGDQCLEFAHGVCNSYPIQHIGHTKNLFISLCFQRPRYTPCPIVQSQNSHNLFVQDYYSHRMLRIHFAVNLS